ncbi:MAG: hypothetical protein ACTSWP_07145 [Candidatus Freyarchaeota archaeon]
MTVGICGSPRKGATEYCLMEALRMLEEDGLRLFSSRLGVHVSCQTVATGDRREEPICFSIPSTRRLEAAPLGESAFVKKPFWLTFFESSSFTVPSASPS